MKPVLAALALLLPVGLASANITVTGEGKVKYTPDIGYIHAGVASDGKTATEAWQKNADAVKKLFEALKGFGIEAKDMKTSGLNVSPRYDQPKGKAPEVVGYTASYDLNVTVRRLDDLGKVLDGLAAAGANRNMGVGFGCSDPEKLLDQARLKAVQEARKKAEIYATGAGCGLGLVDSISESQPNVPRPLEFGAMERSAVDASLPIAAGEQEFSVRVTVVYGVNHLPPGDATTQPLPTAAGVR